MSPPRYAARSLHHPVDFVADRMHHGAMFAASLSKNARRAALLLLPALLIVSVTSCDLVNVGDQSCTEGVNAYDKEDSCPYGPPGGPSVQETGCPDIPQETDPVLCTTTWLQVYDLLTGPKGNCAVGGCHGSPPGARGILLSSTDANAFYDELKAYNGSQGYPYINEENPTNSWILCNLAGVPGGGAPMPPPSGLDEADLALIQNWASCGALR